MTGDLFIDNIDIYSSFGAYVTHQGYNSFVAWPSSKPVSATSWKEMNGEDVDLSTLPLSAREVSISLAFRGGHEQISTFYTYLCGKIYRTWEARSIGVRMPLRLVSISSLETSERLQLMTVRLSHDSPWDLEVREGNSWHVPSIIFPDYPTSESPYRIDGFAFEEYGASVIDGTRDSVMIPGKVKPYMTRNIDSVDGLICDNAAIANTVEKVESTLNMVLYADSLDEFWYNYYRLLGAFIYNPDFPGDMTECSHYLSLPYMPGFRFYYKGQTNMDLGLGPGGSVWATFGVMIKQI